MMYDAYLRFPRAFYDRHATGEVISRATNDIYPVRYFIGWGVVQAIQSVMMLIGASIVLLSVNARLTLFAALAMPPVAILTYVFAHKVFPISRVVQAKKGHLTEATDEAVVGHRDGAGLRPRGRRARALHGPRRGSPRRDDAPGGHRGALPAGLDLPAVARDRGRALLRRPRRDRRQPDDRAVHALHHAAAAARLAARGARLDHQPRAAGNGGRIALLRLARLDRAAARARPIPSISPTAR